MVYPGAMHTRFEHSIGVMHVASRMFDALVRRSKDILCSQDYGYEEGSLARQRKVVRLAALLHDLGHGPFSHAAEELFPFKEDSKSRYEHEDYSAAALEVCLADIIGNHRQSKVDGIRVADILEVFATPAQSAGVLVWKDLVSGQVDADRMDYLLRDALHAGVQYGRYDLDRVLHTVRLCPDPETEGHHIGVEEDGVHAIEGLLIARFMMFTQIYFHKTRTIYDYHLVKFLRFVLDSEVFPPPTRIADYLAWDDWRVLGLLAQGKGDVHGEALRARQHYRMVYSTAEIASAEELEAVEDLADTLVAHECVTRDAEKSWYKSGSEEIKVWRTSGGVRQAVPLQALSPVVKGLIKVNERRLYVPSAERSAAAAEVQRWMDRRRRPV